MTVRASVPPAAAAGRRPARRGRSGALLVAVLLVGIGVAAARAAPHSEPTATAATRTGTPRPTTDRPSAAPVADSSTALPAGQGQGALVALAALRVDDSPARAGYQRDLFGYRAVDLDRNGCDTRNDILRRDLHDVVLKPGTSDCVVLSGMLADPYSGTTIAFTRGTSRPPQPAEPAGCGDVPTSRGPTTDRLPNTPWAPPQPARTLCPCSATCLSPPGCWRC